MLQPLSSVCIRVSSETFLQLLFLMDVAAECERETLEEPAGLFCFLVCEGFGCFGFPDFPPIGSQFSQYSPLHTLRLATTDSPSVPPENHMIPQNPTLFPYQAIKNDLFLLFTEKM